MEIFSKNNKQNMPKSVLNVEYDFVEYWLNDAPDPIFEEEWWWDLFDREYDFTKSDRLAGRYSGHVHTNTQRAFWWGYLGGTG